MTGNSKLTVLAGIGEKTQSLFLKLNINDLQDLLVFFPRAYDRFEDPIAISQAEEERTLTVAGVIQSAPALKRVRSLQILTLDIFDGTEKLTLTWFNMPFLRNKLKKGMNFLFRGKITSKAHKRVMEQPVIYTREEYLSLLHTMQPIYGLTQGLTNNMVKKAVRQVLQEKELLKEHLPNWMLEEAGLISYEKAVQWIHFPNSQEELQTARKRLAFEEFFFFILALRRLSEARETLYHDYVLEPVWDTDEYIQGLPYRLTKAQMRVWREVERDLGREQVMSRLIQGDVGSGKTVIGILALLMTAANGYQGALMVPTEVLARQHFESISKSFAEQGITFTPILLTGSMTAKEKRLACEKIESGEANIIIGTHALIQEKVQYKNLALVITDEQHRFGVKQREAFSKKGMNPHILVMSATPIPRTLAIILYGDLDISVIDELPALRRPIKNCVVDTNYRPTAYRFITKEVQEGRQAYIICPMVEENEEIEAESVIEYTSMLSEVLPSDITVAYLHGKMPGKEKNTIMERFSKNEIQVLVSTTVVEVGVNVPNATVMMIENAERFGLAQLHQLRGRVGRGEHQSYCIFMSSSKTKETKKRLEVLNHSNDGFYIASEDLKMRGPGDFFGIRQSGGFEFKVGDVFIDAGLLKKAADLCGTIMYLDPNLEQEENLGVGQALEHYVNGALTVLNL